MSRKLFCMLLLAVAAPAAPAQTVFPVFLDGGQVSPPTASDEVGAGHLYLNPFLGNVRYEITISGVSGGFNGASVRLGPPGQNGPVLFALVGGPLSFQGVSPVTPTEAAAIQASGAYVDVRSGAFPQGEIRGQVTPTRTQMVAFLLGAKENPPNNSAGAGDGSFDIHPNGTVSYSVEFTGLSGPPVQAHLHRGGPDENGPVIHGLSQSAPGVFSGTTSPLSSSDLAFVRSGRAYVNIHTAAFPGGEIRGQLVTSYTRYGQGCHGPDAGPASLFGGGHPRPGGQVVVGINGGVPGSTGILFIGAVGFELPFEFGCDLFVGPPLIPLVLPPLNPNGNLAINTVLPPTSALGWIQLQYFGEQIGAPGDFYSTNGLSMQVSE